MYTTIWMLLLALLLSFICQAAGSAFCGGSPSVMAFSFDPMASGLLEAWMLATKKISIFNAMHKVAVPKGEISAGTHERKQAGETALLVGAVDLNVKNTDKTVVAPFDTPDRALIIEPSMTPVLCTDWTKHLGQCRTRAPRRDQRQRQPEVNLTSTINNNDSREFDEHSNYSNGTAIHINTDIITNLDLSTDSTKYTCKACVKYGLCDNTSRLLNVCELSDFVITSDSDLDDDFVYEQNRSCSSFGSCGHVHTICRAEVYDETVYEENRACSGFGACGHVKTVYSPPLEVMDTVYDALYADNKACTGFGACGNAYTIYSTTTAVEALDTLYDTIYEDNVACTGFGACGNVHTIYSTIEAPIPKGTSSILVLLAHSVGVMLFLMVLADTSEMLSHKVHSILRTMYRTVDSFMYTIGYKVAVDYTPRDDQDAALLLKALQVVAHQGWLKTTTSLSTSRGVHAYAVQNLYTHLNVHQDMSPNTLQTLLQRASTTHLTVTTRGVHWCNATQGALSNELHNTLVNSLPLLTALTTVRMRNVGRKRMAHYLSIIHEHSTRLSSIELQRNNCLSLCTLPETEHFINLQSLTLKNLKWTSTLPQMLKVLHVESWDLTGVTLPAELKELTLVNSRVLPILPYGLLVLDLSKSGITHALAENTIPSTVRHLKLPAYYQHEIATLPPALLSLDVGLVYNHPLGRLPQALLELVISRDDDYIRHQYTHRLQPLPTGLKVLKVTNVTCITDSIDNFVLPQGLQVLHVGMLKQSIGPLPPALQVLHIDSIDYNTPLGALPATLVELDISSAHKFQRLGALPIKLRKLVVNELYRTQPPRVSKHTAIVCPTRRTRNHERLRAV
eukprot:6762-Heterococcus_DN1.PRE.2